MLNKKEKADIRRKEWKKNNPEKVAAYRKKYNDANKEKIAISGKKRRLANPEKERARAKRYREANPAKCAARARKWRLANPEKLAATWRRWYQKKNKARMDARKELKADRDKYRETYKPLRKEKPLPVEVNGGIIDDYAENTEYAENFVNELPEW